jgi:hypothetical protein
MNEDQQHKKLVSTARITGVWYLILAITGMVGFLALHSQIYVNDDPAKTLNNLTAQNMIARIRLILEFLIILSQALAAVWFYKLFKDLRPVAAWALAAWGMMNSVVIMISAIAMGGAIHVAARAAAQNDSVIIITVFNQVISNAWAVGGLFFGLWLIPMGYVVVSSKCMPLWLGRILILGGAGYLGNTFLKYMGLDDTWVDLLVIPATVGEFWMIGYLLVIGIRPIFIPESNPR